MFKITHSKNSHCKENTIEDIYRMTNKKGGPQKDHRPKKQEAIMDSDLVPVGCLLTLLSLVALVWLKAGRPDAVWDDQ
ncbi:hypothetical protein DPEC_G00021020 [Dallia pectoralis]|uniref:Uncharacterized protein n=1 Tax=Dallia pectoralis TaxID=75939 RepID=A0ACC2HG52_DALPE|nr:hypothetical protein DPEC_G00021020 [Dallia pectoralis]